MPGAVPRLRGTDGPHLEVVFEVERGIPALGLETMDQLHRILDRIESLSHVRTLTFAGSGPIFAAGGDLKEFMGLDTPKKGRAMAEKMRSVLLRLQTLPYPVIALINGDVYGGGVEFALGCDLRFAVKGIKLSLSQCRFGLIPGWGGATRLVHLVGPSRAIMLLTGAKTLDADEAYKIGLVDDVFEPEEAFDGLERFRHQVESCSPDRLSP